MDNRADSGDEYLLWVDGKTEAFATWATAGKARHAEDGSNTYADRRCQRERGFHPERIEAARMTEPRRARRFLRVRDERLQEPALLGGRMDTASAKGYFARLGADALRQRSGVQFRPTGRLTAMTA